MAEHNTLGEKGEELACSYLKEKKYRILARKWRYKHKEIDIIAFYEGIIIFVEVKTRSSDYWGNPEEFVNRRKQKFLIEAAEKYIIEKDFDMEARFDIISVIIGEDETHVEHIEEAFYP
ncbi:MAG: YraN family protein [Bacteroidales bacterium]|nr:YraN family protein [Bacteroidales bacterium]